MNESANQTTPAGWRRVPVKLSIMISDSGLVSLSADAPRNLSVIGHSLHEAFEAFVVFAEDCAQLDQPFEALQGVNLR